MRISGAEDTIEDIDTTVKKCKIQKSLHPKHPGNPEHYEKIKPTDTGTDEKEDSNLKGQEISSTKL